MPEINEDGYEEHQILEVEGFRMVDATATGSRPHDDLVWVGFGGMEGRWLTPDQALAVATGISAVAKGNLLRRGQTTLSTSGLVKLAQRVAGLNVSAEEIGAGTLAQLVQQANSALAEQ